MTARSPRRATLTATAIATLGVLPVFMIGALGPRLRADLGLSTSDLGLAVSVAFLAQAAVSASLGRAVGRIGPRAGIRAASVLAGAAAAALAAAGSLAAILVLLAVTGVANAAAQIAASATLAEQVPSGRQGFAFGLKEAAKPAATLVCGIAVPAVAAVGSWRLAFVACGAAAVVTFLSARVLPAARVTPREPAASARALPSRGLLLVAAGSALASAGATPLGAFLVETLTAAGFGPGACGALLAAGSAGSIAARVVSGVYADRLAGVQLLWTAAMLAAGTCGLMLLATGRPWALVAGTVIAFAGAWGWPGLLNLAVARRHRDTVAASAGVVLTGAALGAGVGPALFGLIATHASFAAAWMACAGFVAAAGVAVLAGRLALLARPG